MNNEKDKKQKFIDSNNLGELLQEQKKMSLNIFKACLRERYKDLCESEFTSKDYKSRFRDFTKRYPIVYSTTHAIRNCSGNNFLYDCVIIDESSQVDLISAVIAFFRGKKSRFGG